ncbi:MAG: FkbM family methyltransferase [Massilia sp.]
MTLHAIADFFPSPDELKAKIVSLAGALRKDLRSMLPPWLDDANGDFFRRRRFIACGPLGYKDIRVLSSMGEVVAVVDDRLAAIGEPLFGIPVISTGAWIDQVKADRDIVSVLLAVTMHESRHFIMQCVQHDMKLITPIQYLLLLRLAGFRAADTEGRIFRYGWDYFDITLNNVEEHFAVADLFSDHYSKIAYLNLMLYRLTLNPMYLEQYAVGRGGYYDYNTYLFEKTFIALGEQEVYVDAGAFDGDSLTAFLFAVKGKYRHIYTFEPGPESNRQIRARLAGLESEYGKPLGKSITLIEKGVWSSTTTLKFSPNFTYEDANTRSSPLGGHLLESGLRSAIDQSSIDDSQLHEVPVTTIDEATNQDATFIKYEVEGSELQGLMGARRTIERNRPRLAVAVYHKPEDLLVLPRYVRDMGMDYKIGFRQHDRGTPDATYIYCY